jgi:hypothetical protein
LENIFQVYSSTHQDEARLIERCHLKHIFSSLQADEIFSR